MTVWTFAFVFVNLTEILLCLWDKFCACTHRWRVPEKVFFTLAFLGGALGLIVGMLLAHHKVSKPSFVKVVAAAGAANLIVMVLLFN